MAREGLGGSQGRGAWRTTLLGIERSDSVYGRKSSGLGGGKVLGRRAGAICPQALAA